MVILDKEHYIAEANRQLSKENHYKKSKNLSTLTLQIEYILNELKDLKLIDKKQLEYFKIDHSP